MQINPAAFKAIILSLGQSSQLLYFQLFILSFISFKFLVYFQLIGIRHCLNS